MQRQTRRAPVDLRLKKDSPDHPTATRSQVIRAGTSELPTSRRESHGMSSHQPDCRASHKSSLRLKTCSTGFEDFNGTNRVTRPKMSTKRPERPSPNEIARMLRDMDAILSTGKDPTAMLQSLKVSESTLKSWRGRYGAMKTNATGFRPVAKCS
jgi:hypothetical protein